MKNLSGAARAYPARIISHLRDKAGRKILIAEDDIVFARCLKDELIEDGYEVEVVSDGCVAFRTALSGEFALILLDIGLPTKDGLEVCRSLRNAQNRTPILIVTSRTSEVDRQNALLAGADVFLPKPFSRGHLRHSIDNLLAPQRSLD